MSEKEIAVSVICNAYNQEKLIRKALEGFAMQKTTFAFEVLIHDDASTDHTADVIREFEEKYPEIMRPIYDKENLYSRHDDSLFKTQYGRVKGKYIAMCEGDDYWTDPYKLQKQYDALESHPEVDICAHRAIVLHGDKEESYVAPAEEDTLISIEQVILGGGGYLATASLMYRSSLLNNPPRFVMMMSLDYLLQIYASMRGGLIYLNDCMAVYRLENAGSWSQQMRVNKQKYLAHMKRVEEVLRFMDEETGKKFHSTVEQKIRINRFDCFWAGREYKGMCRKDYRDLFQNLPIKRKAIVRIGAIVPRLADWAMDHFYKG